MALDQLEVRSLSDGFLTDKGSCCVLDQTYSHLTASPLHQIGHAWNDQLRLPFSRNIFLQPFEVCNITDVGSAPGLLQLLCWFFSCMIRFIENCLSLLWLLPQRAFICMFSQQTGITDITTKNVSRVLLKPFWVSMLVDEHTEILCSPVINSTELWCPTF